MFPTLTERCSRPRVLIGLQIAVVAIGFAIGAVGPAVRPGGPKPVELPLARRLGTFQQILCDWANPGGVPKTDPRRPCSRADPNPSSALTRARWAVIIDFAFIACYVPFLSGFYEWLVRTSNLRRPLGFLVAVPWAAGAFDVVENICLLWVIPRNVSGIPGISPTAVHLLFVVSSTKWALVAISIVSSLNALFSGERGTVLRLVRYSLLSVAFGSVPLIATDQGRDLLVALADAGGPHWAAFTIAGWLWGLSVWYWSRLLVNAQFGPRLLIAADRWALYVPRALGALTFVLPGIGALLIRGQFDHTTAPNALALGCFVSAALFLWFTHWRRKYLTAKNMGVSPVGTGVPGAAKAVVTLSLLAAFVLLIFFIASPIHLPTLLGAPAVLALAAAGLVFVGSLFVLMSRGFRMPLDVIAIVLASVFSLWNDNHQIRPHPFSAGDKKRADLLTGFDRWRRQQGIGPDDHVVLVASEGGGIRAAYWTASALTKPFISDERAKRLFAISGVSGGAIGAAAYGAFRHDSLDHQHAVDAALKMLKTPLLAPVLARLFNGEFAQWFLWFPVERFDRSKVFEQSLAEAYAPLTGTPNTFERDYLQLWTGDATRDPPALLFTSTSVEHGSRIVTSPFTWPSPQGDRADLHELIRGDLSLAQAAHNSARFTYVSPVGQLYSIDGEAQGGLVDGGYFENSGAEALLDIMYELRLAKQHEKFDVVFVCSSPGACPEFWPKHDGTIVIETANSDARVLSPWVPREGLGELLGPVRALYRARPAHEDLTVRRLYEAATDFQVIAICTGARVPHAAEPPLGWEMSPRMIDQIDRRAKTGAAVYPCSELAGRKR